MPLQCHKFLEIWFSIIIAYGIRGKKWYIHGLDQPVIHRMPRLYVMISYNDSVIADVLHHTGKDML